MKRDLYILEDVISYADTLLVKVEPSFSRDTRLVPIKKNLFPLKYVASGDFAAKDKREENDRKMSTKFTIAEELKS